MNHGLKYGIILQCQDNALKEKIVGKISKVNRRLILTIVLMNINRANTHGSSPTPTEMASGGQATLKPKNREGGVLSRDHLHRGSKIGIGRRYAIRR